VAPGGLAIARSATCAPRRGRCRAANPPAARVPAASGFWRSSWRGLSERPPFRLGLEAMPERLAPELPRVRLRCFYRGRWLWDQRPADARGGRRSRGRVGPATSRQAGPNLPSW